MCTGEPGAYGDGWGCLCSQPRCLTMLDGKTPATTSSSSLPSSSSSPDWSSYPSGEQRPDYSPVLMKLGVLPTYLHRRLFLSVLTIFSLPVARILHCTVVYPLELYPAFFGYYFFNSMMGVLQMLHIFWAYLILRMAHKFITGKVKESPIPIL